MNCQWRLRSLGTVNPLPEQLKLCDPWTFISCWQPTCAELYKSIYTDDPKVYHNESTDELYINYNSWYNYIPPFCSMPIVFVVIQSSKYCKCFLHFVYKVHLYYAWGVYIYINPIPMFNSQTFWTNASRYLMSFTFLKTIKVGMTHSQN